MLSNKNPEETINNILSIALNLFTGKGYDDTTIQDIANEVGCQNKKYINILNQRKT